MAKISFEDFDKAFTKQINKIDATVFDAIDNKVFDFVKEYIYENIPSKGDKLIVDENTIIAIRKLGDKLNKHLANDSDIQDFADVALKNIRAASQSQIEYFGSNGMPVSTPTIKGNLSLIADNLLNEFSTVHQTGLSAIKRIIVRGLSVGVSKSQLEEQLLNERKLGKFSKYINAYTSFAADAYTGTVNQQQFTTYKDQISAIRISGTLIKTSSPQCRKCIKDYNKVIPINDFQNIILPLAADNGLIEGTDIKNVFVNKLHYGCRHNFTPII